MRARKLVFPHCVEQYLTYEGCGKVRVCNKSWKLAYICIIKLRMHMVWLSMCNPNFLLLGEQIEMFLNK